MFYELVVHGCRYVIYARTLDLVEVASILLTKGGMPGESPLSGKLGLDSLRGTDPDGNIVGDEERISKCRDRVLDFHEEQIPMHLISESFKHKQGSYHVRG